MKRKKGSLGNKRDTPPKKKNSKKLKTRLKTVKMFGRTLYYNPEMMESHNPLRVAMKTGRIEIHPKTFDSYPKEFQYFLVRWGIHSFKLHKQGVMNVEKSADQPAMIDCYKKGYGMKSLFKNFVHMLNYQQHINEDRIKAMVDFS